MCHVMLYNIFQVILCYITYVMTSKLYFVLMQLLNSVLFALGEKYKTALIYYADHKLLSLRNPLYLNHVINSIFLSCGNVLYSFRLLPIQRRLSGIKNKS